MRVFYVEASDNVKTGKIPVSYIEEATCPQVCPLKKAGCYAELGPSSTQWKKADKVETSISFEEYLTRIKKIERGRLHRYGVAGDLPGFGNRLDQDLLLELAKANAGRQGFLYTHKPLWHDGEREAIQEANARGLTINLSADTLQEADRKVNYGVAPVVVIIPSDPALWPSQTPEGRRIVVCPATTHGKTCLECRLCAVPARSYIIGLAAHGVRKKRVEALCKA